MPSINLAQQQDKEDIRLSHQYRLQLPSSPTQSNFRVLALLFYEELESRHASTLPPWVPQTTSDGRTYIVGTNDEPGYIGGAICAERAAMVQFRFLKRGCFRINKLVIATDAHEPISPGLLCREFLAGKDCIPWDVDVISTGDSHDHDNAVCRVDDGEHEIKTLKTTLKELYPFPSPYTRLHAPESVSLGEIYSKNILRMNEKEKMLFDLSVSEARSNLSHDIHPIMFGAAVLFEDGTIATSHQLSALEYGCTLDAVSQLASRIKKNGSRPGLIVQTDQYGIAHAPFAPARSFLTEYGFGDCMVLLTKTCLENVEDIDQWELKQVRAADLAPYTPAWTSCTDR
mmetsp:Transcript_20258/g.30209  ORF Transcript_20258/g.30209 Transcript_20258/m.30209 type:complete len:343 (-) Transcript_20258:469-1497(-)